MRTALLLLALGLAGYNAYNRSAPPTLKTPLVLTLSRTVGMTPFTLQAKVRAQVEGREVCLVVDGPESMRSCRTLYGVTWTQDFTLHTGGDYAVFAISGNYRTPETSVHVVGLGEEQ